MITPEKDRRKTLIAGASSDKNYEVDIFSSSNTSASNRSARSSSPQMLLAGSSRKGVLGNLNRLTDNAGQEVSMVFDGKHKKKIMKNLKNRYKRDASTRKEASKKNPKALKKVKINSNVVRQNGKKNKLKSAKTTVELSH